MLESFRQGSLAVLVCTDVASRGIDVPEVARVIHAELPDNAEVLTHRSGRTGRAGRKGVSIMLVPLPQYRYAENLLRQANVNAELVPAPSEREVLRKRDERLFEQLTKKPEGEEQQADEADKADDTLEAPVAVQDKLAKRLIETLGAEQAVAVLLERLRAQGPCAPQALSEVRIAQPAERPVRKQFRPERPGQRVPERRAQRAYRR
jgi:ATP-dependent RNA helicase DeaD